MSKQSDKEIAPAHPLVVITAFCYDPTIQRFVVLKRGEKTRDQVGKWDIVQGVLETDLTPEQNMRKEIREELGVFPIGKLRFLGYRALQYHDPKAGREHYTALDFIARVERRTVHNAEPEHHDQLHWATLQTVPEPMHVMLSQYLALYRTELERALRNGEAQGSRDA